MWGSFPHKASVASKHKQSYSDPTSKPYFKLTMRHHNVYEILTFNKKSHNWIQSKQSFKSLEAFLSLVISHKWNFLLSKVGHLRSNENKPLNKSKIINGKPLKTLNFYHIHWPSPIPNKFSFLCIYHKPFLRNYVPQKRHQGRPKLIFRIFSI